MASGQAYDAAESQSLLGATITSDMDLTDMSFNDFFSFTDDVSTAGRLDKRKDGANYVAFLFLFCLLEDLKKCYVVLCFSCRYPFHPLRIIFPIP